MALNPIEILKDTLVNMWGYDISNISNEEIPFIYFNAENRRPINRKRRIEISDIFNCPSQLENGWESLKLLIKSGQNILPNLSKMVTKLNKKDSLLYDWGIYHFHLGENFFN